MKMAKSLLLGSAAGIVAVAGAQAADLPVKAKPVEYVKVCSLYGAGYYYIPGTDICQKIGGDIRYEKTFGFGENKTSGPWIVSATTSSPGLNTRANGVADFVQTVRAYITAETRQQTQYGTLRTYLNVGLNIDSPANSNLGQSAGGFNANRAFIQIAGFTLGRATSFYDFYSAPATGLFAAPSSDIGDPGQIVTAYTMQFGNGLSASISLEDGTARRAATVNASGTAFSTLGGAPMADSKKYMFPDVVGNLRVDQAWGSAQIMGVLHDASGAYGGTTTTGVTGTAGQPADKWGFAVGAGVKINFPMIGPGDYLQAQVNYAQGASKYVAVSLGSASAWALNGASVGYGLVSDGVYCGAAASTQATGCAALGITGVQLTTSWGVNVAYEHFWTPALRTSLIGSYFATSYNATANAAICGEMTAGTITGAACSNNYSWWTVGSRSQWNVTKDFYLATDVIYMKLNTASSGGTYNNSAAVGAVPAGPYAISNQSALGVRWRAHRDIVP